MKSQIPNHNSLYFSLSLRACLKWMVGSAQRGVPTNNRGALNLLCALSLLMLTLLSANAQNAADFFHGGALSYLSNNIPGALEVVTNGLQRFPEDEKLKKLYELLNQKQQQQQQQQDQQNQDQKDKEKDQQDQKQDKQEKNEQQKQDEQKKQQEAKDKQEQEKKDQQAKSGDKEEKKGDPQQVAAHQMTPQEAKQLLDAQKDDEQVLIFQPQGEPKNKTKQLKDW